MHLVPLFFSFVFCIYALHFIGLLNSFALVAGCVLFLFLLAKSRMCCATKLPYCLWHCLGVVEDIGNKAVLQTRRWKYMLFMISVVFLYACFIDIALVLFTEHLVRMLLLLLILLCIIGASKVYHRLEEAVPAEIEFCLAKFDSSGTTTWTSIKWFHSLVTKKLVPGTLKQQEALEEFHGLFEKGEYEILSGICIEMPCCDQYAPNTSGCCLCCPPTYEEETYTASDFYTNIMPQLRTGDIYLGAFPRHGALEANFMLHTKWTHAGIIYRRSDCPEILKHTLREGGVTQDNSEVDASRPLIAEVLDYGDPNMEAFTLSDFETSSLRYLAQKPSWYAGEVTKSESAEAAARVEPFMIAVRFLRNPDGTQFTRDTEFYQQIEAAITTNLKCGYAFNQLPLALNFGQWAIPHLKKLKAPGLSTVEGVLLAENDVDESGKDKIFCAEFVADVYQRTGLLDAKLNKNEFSPACFDSSRHLCLRGAKLSGEHVLIGMNSKDCQKKPDWVQRYNESFIPLVNTKCQLFEMSEPRQQSMYTPPEAPNDKKEPSKDKFESPRENKKQIEETTLQPNEEKKPPLTEEKASPKESGDENTPSLENEEGQSEENKPLPTDKHEQHD
eukprot:TRINITY_DN45778_c0_g1_i1.p1 TRINITY_DN45778_c0_g1~~TRINITY_DN45778_c0_g1_i1.p1  ORF type:complete len:614 (+),score=104.82 TRINITY_DN45778_c0_g1_i1:69-1910(+)